MIQAQVRDSWSNPDSWFSATEIPRLENDEAHVLLARLDEEKAAPLEQTLSNDERARAERFRFERDKKHFIVARGLLRKILGKYLNENPRLIRFEYNKFGKPSIAGESQTAIRFNLSHSDGLALYAVSRGRQIGVDVERIKPSLIEDEMLSQVFTSKEIAHFQNLNGNERNTFFFDCWTRKEAYLKACGSGLSLPANQIETLFSSQFSAQFANSQQTSFSLQNLPSISGYAAALAVEGNSPRVRFWLCD